MCYKWQSLGYSLNFLKMQTKSIQAIYFLVEGVSKSGHSSKQSFTGTLPHPVFTSQLLLSHVNDSWVVATHTAPKSRTGRAQNRPLGSGLLPHAHCTPSTRPLRCCLETPLGRLPPSGLPPTPLGYELWRSQDRSVKWFDLGQKDFQKKNTFPLYSKPFYL